jgi:hypothetical protein
MFCPEDTRKPVWLALDASEEFAMLDQRHRSGVAVQSGSRRRGPLAE